MALNVVAVYPFSEWLPCLGISRLLIYMIVERAAVIARTRHFRSMQTQDPTTETGTPGNHCIGTAALMTPNFVERRSLFEVFIETLSIHTNDKAIASD